MPNRQDEPAGDAFQPRVDISTMFSLYGRHSMGALPGVPHGQPAADPVECRRRFDEACAKAEPRSAVATNRLLLDVFGGVDQLSLPDLMRAFGREARKRASRIERVVPPAAEAAAQAYAEAGAFVGACFRLRLVAMEGPAGGEAQFRLIDHKMQFELRGGRAVRVRGQTPAERDRQERQARANARRNETLDRRARDAANPTIGRLIDALVRRDRLLKVPRSWHVAGYLPEHVVGSDLVASAPFVAGYHQTAGFDRKRLLAWQECLALAVEQGCGASQTGDSGPAGPVRIEPADLEALASLAPRRPVGGDLGQGHDPRHVPLRARGSNEPPSTPKPGTD